MVNNSEMKTEKAASDSHMWVHGMMMQMIQRIQQRETNKGKLTRCQLAIYTLIEPKIWVNLTCMLSLPLPFLGTYNFAELVLRC